MKSKLIFKFYDNLSLTKARPINLQLIKKVLNEKFTINIYE